MSQGVSVVPKMVRDERLRLWSSPPPPSKHTHTQNKVRDSRAFFAQNYEREIWIFPHVPASFISLHIRSMWETICDAQAGFWLNSKFLSKFSRKPLSGISDQKAPPPFQKTSDLRWNTPPPFRKTSDLRWPKFTSEYAPPHFGKLQIWDDQSLLRNTRPPFRKTSDLRWPKFTPEYPPPPPPFRKTSDLRWPKFTSEYPPPPFRKTSDLRWPKFTPEYPTPPIRKMREIVCGD